MKKTFSNNPIVSLLRSITDVVNEYVLGGKDRAVNIQAIWMAVQKQLDSTGTETEFGMEPSGYVVDIYVEEAGTFAIITKNDGKLYKVAVSVDANSQITLGAEQEVVMDFAPVSRQVTVKRQANGQVRWFAMPACTAVLNRSGEIDSRALFDSFVEYVDRTGNYPELDFFHLGESILLGKADWVGRDGFAYCASGTFYDTPIARAAINALEENKDYWGLSIAYLPTGEPEKIRSSEGIEITVFNSGINRFISMLPEDTAASILTNISTQEEVNRMNKKVAEALKLLTGDDETLFKELSEKVDSVNRSADGMINRETPKDVPPAVTVQVPTLPQTRAMSTEDMTALFGSTEFKDAVTAIFNDLYQQDAKEDEVKPVSAETETDTQRAAASDVVIAALNELKAKVDELGKTRDAGIQEVLNDLPSKISRATIVRPRATRMPEDVHTRTNVSFAEVAAETLAKMGESA